MPFGPDGYGLPRPLTNVSKATFVRYVYESCEHCTTDERPLTDAQDNPAGTVKDYLTTDGQVLAKVLYHVEGREDEYFIVDPPAPDDA